VKKVLLLAIVALVVLVAVYRRRIFLRDPLAKLSRNDVAQESVAVYINAENDVLVDDTSSSGTPRFMVQSWNKVPESPAVLTCIRWMVCVSDADHATAQPLVLRNGYNPQVTMSNREVSFTDSAGAAVKIALW